MLQFLIRDPWMVVGIFVRWYQSIGIRGLASVECWVDYQTHFKQGNKIYIPSCNIFFFASIEGISHCCPLISRVWWELNCTSYSIFLSNLELISFVFQLLEAFLEEALVWFTWQTEGNIGSLLRWRKSLFDRCNPSMDVPSFADGWCPWRYLLFSLALSFPPRK